MSQLAARQPRELSSADRVSYAQFLALTDGLSAEWIDGKVVPLVTVSILHNDLTAFLIAVFQAFLGERPIGRLFHEPFQMKTGPNLPGRSPDVMILANEHLSRRQRDHLRGPADLAIEIISPGTARVDRGEKLAEYEAGGVREYWILDPATQEADFYQLDEHGTYHLSQPDEQGIYRSTSVPGFWLRVEWLWSRPTVRRVLSEIVPD